MGAAQRVLEIAAAEVGVTENPRGSNTGRRVREYQAATSLAGTGWPWCAAFVEWVWRRAGVDTRACSPSTAVMRTLAHRRGWLRDTPTPGAAILWPGRHVGIVTAVLGPGIVATIEGNTSDMVARRVRSTAAAVFVVPPEIAGSAAGPTVEFWLEDPAARPVLRGPWRTRAMRDRAIARLPKARRARVRAVRAGKRYAFLEGPRRLYGPWPTRRQRDNARQALEARLGRRLRPYSRPAPAAAPRPEALGRTV